MHDITIYNRFENCFFFLTFESKRKNIVDLIIYIQFYDIQIKKLSKININLTLKYVRNLNILYSLFVFTGISNNRDKWTSNLTGNQITRIIKIMENR